MFRSRTALAVSILLSSLACQKKSAPAPEPQVASKPASSQAASVPAPVATPRTDYLVVISIPGASPEAAPSYQTRWVLGESKEAVAATLSRDDLVVSDGKDLWFWAERTEKTKGIDCECYDPFGAERTEEQEKEQLKKCTKEKDTSFGILQNSKGDKRELETPIASSKPASAPSENDLTSLDSSDVEYTPLSVWGPWLFFTSSSMLYACGAAHGATGVTFQVMDLRSGKFVEPWETSARDAVAAANKDKAKEGLCIQSDHAPDEPCNIEIALTTFYPTVADQKAKLSLQFTTDAAYASSDFKWNSYTVSKDVVVDELPKFLDEWKLPEAVQKQAGNTKVLGWTPITGTPAELDALQKSFQQRPVFKTSKK